MSVLVVTCIFPHYVPDGIEIHYWRKATFMCSQGSNFKVLSDFFFFNWDCPQHVLVLVVVSICCLFYLFILKEGSSVSFPSVEEGWLLYLPLAGYTWEKPPRFLPARNHSLLSMHAGWSPKCVTSVKFFFRSGKNFFICTLSREDKNFLIAPVQLLPPPALKHLKLSCSLC